MNICLFSLNLRFGLAKDGDNSWANRKTVYPMLIENHMADFFCFQEANDFQIDFLKNRLPGYGIIGQRDPAPDFWQNNIICSHPRWHCIEKQHFYLSDTPDKPSKFAESQWPRQCTIGVFQCGGYTLLCVNTHFDFKPEVQDASARLIMDRLSKWPDALPAILAGDFNANPGAGAYRIFTRASQNRNPAFNDAFSGNFEGTFHGFTGQADKDPIDWILYRGALKKKRAEIIKDNFGGQYPSDHYPLCAEFSFQGE